MEWWTIATLPGRHAHQREIALVTTGYRVAIRFHISIKSMYPIWIEGFTAGSADLPVLDVSRFTLPFFGFDPDECLCSVRDQETIRDLYTPIRADEWYTTDLFRRVVAVAAHIDFRRPARLDYFVRVFNSIIKTHGGTISLYRQEEDQPAYVVSNVDKDDHLMILGTDGIGLLQTSKQCIQDIIRQSFPTSLSLSVCNVPTFPELGEYVDMTARSYLTVHRTSGDTVLGIADQHRLFLKSPFSSVPAQHPSSVIGHEHTNPAVRSSWNACTRVVLPPTSIDRQ